MAVDMQRLVEGGAIVHFEDDRVTPVESLPGRGRKPGHAIEGPGIALLDQAAEIKRLAIELRSGHSSLFSAFDNERDRFRRGKVEIARDRVGGQREIIGEDDMLGLAGTREIEHFDDVLEKVKRNGDVFVSLLDKEIDALTGYEGKGPGADATRFGRLPILSDDPGLGTFEKKRHRADIRGIEEAQPDKAPAR